MPPRCTSCIVTPNQRVYSIENNSKGPPLLSLLALSHSYSCAGQSGRCPAQISPPVRACLSAWRSVVSLPQWSGTSTSHHISPQPCCWGGPTRRLRWARPLLPTPLMHTLCSEPATWVTWHISDRCHSLSLLLSGSIICILHRYPTTEELSCIHVPLHHSLNVPGDPTWH